MKWLAKHSLVAPVKKYELTPIEMREKIFQAIPGNFSLIPAHDQAIVRRVIAEYVTGVVPPTLEEMRSIVDDLNEIMGLKPPLEADWPDELFIRAFDKVIRAADPYDNFHERTWEVIERYGAGPERKLKTPIRKGDRRLVRHIFGPNPNSFFTRMREFIRSHKNFTLEQLREVMAAEFPHKKKQQINDQARNYLSRFKREEGWRITKIKGLYHVEPPERID